MFLITFLVISTAIVIIYIDRNLLPANLRQYLPTCVPTSSIINTVT